MCQSENYFVRENKYFISTGRSFALMKSIREIDVIYLLIDSWIETNIVHLMPKSMQDSQFLPIA